VTATPAGPSPLDTRQQLAADRTLLAWIRTAIALAGLGFVVARFNLFLGAARGASAATTETARFLGVGLVVAAALVVVVGLLQHRQVTVLLSSHGDLLPSARWPALAGALLALLAIIAVGIYLAANAR
jgi:inner membrane protein YidH